MESDTKATSDYAGFEQGPIRPPSEARSLLIRVTRNCPWNRCTFCPVYKGTRFSIRPVEHVKRDIDHVHRWIEVLRAASLSGDRLMRSQMPEHVDPNDPTDSAAFTAAYNWFNLGHMESVFLQDANSLVVKPDRLVEILVHLRTRFPETQRITSYARSETVARISDDDMQALAQASLNRIHIGLESGCDEVLSRVKKGTDKAKAITAGQKVRRAGIELSEYYMPGLGGRDLSQSHAIDSADTLNQINPDFIRLRTLAIPGRVPLFEECMAGQFERCTDLEVVGELLLFLEKLEGITSRITSDHVLNLFEDLEGKLPDDKERMMEIPRRFLAMDPRRRYLYQVGRRLGYFRSIDELDNPRRLAHAEAACAELGVTPENVDEMVQAVMARFI